MVESGLATATEYLPDVSHSAELQEAQRRAMDDGLGPWGTTTTATPTTTTLAPTTTTAPITTTAAPPTTATPTTTAAPASNCHSSYQGACLMVGQGDYDCPGGTGNGPNYVERSPWSATTNSTLTATIRRGRLRVERQGLPRLGPRKRLTGSRCRVNEK